LGVDLHCHNFSSPNSSYFAQNRRFYLLICAKSTNSSRKIFLKKSEPAKAGPPPGQPPSSPPNASFPLAQRPAPPRFARFAWHRPPYASARPPQAARPLALLAPGRHATSLQLPAQLTPCSPRLDKRARQPPCSHRPKTAPPRIRLRTHALAPCIPPRLPTSSSPQRNATSRPAHFRPAAPSS
jgi:hypothetical protein